MCASSKAICQKHCHPELALLEMHRIQIIQVPPLCLSALMSVLWMGSYFRCHVKQHAQRLQDTALEACCDALVPLITVSQV